MSPVFCLIFAVSNALKIILLSLLSDRTGILGSFLSQVVSYKTTSYLLSFSSNKCISLLALNLVSASFEAEVLIFSNSFNVKLLIKNFSSP